MHTRGMLANTYVIPSSNCAQNIFNTSTLFFCLINSVVFISNTPQPFFFKELAISHMFVWSSITFSFFMSLSLRWDFASGKLPAKDLLGEVLEWTSNLNVKCNFIGGYEVVNLFYSSNVDCHELQVRKIEQIMHKIWQ